MTLAKAQAVASAIIGAGYQAHAFLRSDGEWVVRAKSNALDVPVGTANSLATSQGVTGLIAEIEYT